MAWSTHDYDKVPGTYVFNGRRSVIGYPLNRMCMSFNSAENREAFTRDEDAYCAKYGLSPEQREAIRSRDVLRLVQLGGNIYYLAKFAGIFGLPRSRKSEGPATKSDHTFIFNDRTGKNLHQRAFASPIFTAQSNNLARACRA